MPRINTGIGISGIGGQGVLLNLCPEFKTVMASMVVKPTGLDLIAQNQYMKDIVAMGLYAKFPLIYFPSGHDADAALTNWKTPGTYNLTKVNAPIWTLRRGIKGNSATSSYYKTGYIPSAHSDVVGINNLSFCIGIETELADSSNDFGVLSSTSASSIYLGSKNTSNQKWGAVNASGYIPKPNLTSRGHYCYNRSVSTGYTAWKNKHIFETISSTSVALPDKEIYVDALNNNGTVGYISNRNIAYLLIGPNVTETDKNNAVIAYERYAATMGFSLYPQMDYIADGTTIDTALWDITNLDPAKIEIFQNNALVLRGIYPGTSEYLPSRNYIVSKAECNYGELTFSVFRSADADFGVGLQYDTNNFILITQTAFLIKKAGSIVYTTPINSYFANYKLVMDLSSHISLYYLSDDAWVQIGTTQTFVMPPMKFMIAINALPQASVISVRDIKLI
jgi:hypothetical protein